MATEWSLLKNTLLVAYIAKNTNRDLTRRKLGTFIYILDNISNKESVSSINIYPDGIDIPDVNIILDVLRSSSLIDIQRRNIKITKNGIKKIEKMLSNPDDYRFRINYRLVSYLIKYDYNTLMNLAIYLAKKSSGEIIVTEELSEIISGINDIVNKFSEKEERKMKRRLINK